MVLLVQTSTRENIMYSVVRSRLAVARAATTMKGRGGGALRVLATSGGPNKPPRDVGNSSSIEVQK